MRKYFSDIFVDPKTKANLRLRVESEKGEKIISGVLYSDKNVYPIIRGIPRFIAKKFYLRNPCSSKESQTANSFGIKWRGERSRKMGSVRQDIKMLKEQFMALLGCESEFQLINLFKNVGRVLNAGCGVAWSEHLFNYNLRAERHCIDISMSVEAAYRKTSDIHNIIISQSSIFEMPYPDDFFDIVYSDGVVHHTSDAKEAIRILVKKLIPGGLVGIYVYAKKPFLRKIADREIRKITTKMSYKECMVFSRKMSNLGMALSKIKQPLVIKEDIELLNIKKGKYDLHKLIYDHFLKCWFNSSQDIAYADLVNQDWYHPYCASFHTKEEIVGWLKASGVHKLRCIQPKGWEHSGYFISGRKI